MHSTGFNPHFRKGSDLSHCSAFQSGSCFNPHFRKGSDNRKQDVRELTEVSIHTSAREVTAVLFAFLLCSSCFNPHFRKGSDQETVDVTSDNASFNPHFRKGSDLGKTASLRKNICFNPHFRKGSDEIWTHKLFTRLKFQSTLPQGK